MQAQTRSHWWGGIAVGNLHLESAETKLWKHWREPKLYQKRYGKSAGEEIVNYQERQQKGGRLFMRIQMRPRSKPKEWWMDLRQGNTGRLRVKWQQIKSDRQKQEGEEDKSLLTLEYTSVLSWSRMHAALPSSYSCFQRTVKQESLPAHCQKHMG